MAHEDGFAREIPSGTRPGSQATAYLKIETVMILKFPDLQSFHTFLADRAVSPHSLAGTVRAGFDEKNSLWVESPIQLSRAQQTLLRNLKVESGSTCPIELNLSAPSWNQLKDARQLLLFPTADLFRLALSQPILPHSITQLPVNACKDEQGRFWVEQSPLALGHALNELLALGVKMIDQPQTIQLQPLTCWLQLIDLEPDPKGMITNEQTPVLFQITGAGFLAQLSGEILRLGNDRQMYRWMESPDLKSSADGMALLRVIGPPYYSLLSALDRPAEGNPASVAYTEQAPRVWVQLGFRHRLARQIRIDPGQILLLRAPDVWQLLPEAPWRDLYEILDFHLPHPVSHLAEADLKNHFPVKLTFRSSGSTEGGELWVLEDNPIEELNRFVQEADNFLLGRLSFAIGELDGKKTAVVRILQSRQAPPVLVFQRATPYRPYLKLPNLFLPCGQSIRPPIRRDLVRKLLAPELSLVYWLKPLENNQFVPQCLPEQAFRPLLDWVDYILEQEQQNLKAWIGSAQFEFEPFICGETDLSSSKKPRNKEPAPGPGLRSKSPNRKNTPAEDNVNPAAVVPLKEESFTMVEETRSKLQEELAEIETQFVQLEGGLDLPERINQWPRLARLYSQLGNPDDACVCWIHAIWNQPNLSREMCLTWIGLESGRLLQRSRDFVNITGSNSSLWLTGMPDLQKSSDSVGESLDVLLRLKDPNSDDVRTLASILVGIEFLPNWIPAIEKRLNPIQQFLERYESILSIRVVWLAWKSLFLLSRGDILSLVRARDRLLERLYQKGLRPELELPTFLRFAGQATSHRYRLVRNWIIQLADRAKQWVLEDGKGPDQQGTQEKKPTLMDGYVDLIFSFGLACLGEINPAQRLLQQARECFQRGTEVQQLLCNAYQYRIEQVMAGKPHGGPLSGEILERQNALSTLQGYQVDRLRKRSRILEPDQKINPYLNALKDTKSVPEWKDLVELEKIQEPQEVMKQIQRLLRDSTNDSIRLDIIQVGMNHAPGMGPLFAQQLLTQTLTILQQNLEPDSFDSTKRAALIEQGLFVASHFDFREQVTQLINQFKTFLVQSNDKNQLDDLGTIAGQCFRRIRKLGMRNEIDQLILQIHKMLLKDRDLQSSDLHTDPLGSDRLRVLLHIASSWYYVGKYELAEPIVKEARVQLYGTTSPTSTTSIVDQKKKKLACTYALTVGQGPLEQAQKRLEELFTSLTGMRDALLSENKPYLIEQIEIIEAVVLAVISDDFTLGSQTQRWLDDDEFMIRRSIHQDIREATRPN